MKIEPARGIVLAMAASACWAVPSEPARVFIVPQTAFALPLVDGVRMDWAIPPSKSRGVVKWVSETSPSARFRFDVDPDGKPWFVDGADRLFLMMNEDLIPMRTEARFDDGVSLDGGARLFCADHHLSTASVDGKENRKTENGLVVARLNPFLGVSGGDCRLFSAGERALYVVTRREKTGMDDVYRLRSDLKEPGRLERLFSSSTTISALAGDGEKTYYAAGRRILERARGATQAKTVYTAEEPVTGLAYSSKAGLFFTTTRHAGFAGPGFDMNFLTSPYPEIALRGDAVYVRISRTFAVLKVSGAEKFKSLKWGDRAARDNAHLAR